MSDEDLAKAVIRVLAASPVPLTKHEIVRKLKEKDALFHGVTPSKLNHVLWGLLKRAKLVDVDSSYRWKVIGTIVSPEVAAPLSNGAVPSSMPNEPDNDGEKRESDGDFRQATFIAKLVEHIFVSEVLQEVFFSFGKTVDVFHADVDAFGYDLAFDCNGIMRHVQLKSSKDDAKASFQKVNVALVDKPSGCVVWVSRTKNPNTNRWTLSYLFFGDEAGEPLPSLDEFAVATHTKGNVEGVKAERLAIKKVPKTRFRRVQIGELVQLLFGLENPAEIAHSAS